MIELLLPTSFCVTLIENVLPSRGFGGHRIHPELIVLILLCQKVRDVVRLEREELGP